MRCWRVYVSLCVSLVCSSSGAAQQVGAPAEPARIALVIGFADGRSTAELVSAKPGSMWTPRFPRITSPGPDKRSTLSIRALQVSRVLVDEGVRVDVSLLMSAGPPTQVESTVVRRWQSISIDALRRFGIEPIVLSLVDVAQPVSTVPVLESVAPELAFEGLDFVVAPYPGYRVTVRNLGRQSVALIHLQTYLGTQKGGSSQRATGDGRPLVAPNALYEFVIPVSTGAIEEGATVFTPAMPDRITIDGVRWDDGSAIGHPQMLSPGRVREEGRRIQLGRIVEAYRAELSEGLIVLSRLRITIDGLDCDDPSLLQDARDGLRQERLAALDILRRYTLDSRTPPSQQALRDWLTATVTRYIEQEHRLAQ